MTLFGTHFRLARTSVFVVGLALTLALGACSSSSSDTTTVAVNDGTVPIDEPGGNEAPDQDSGSDGSVDTVPSQDGLDSVPVLEPTLEIEIGDTDQPKSAALSPDGSLVAVLGGGQFREVSAFLRIYDTNSGDLVREIPITGGVGESVGRIYWTADNRLVGTDTISFETQVVTWDGASFELVDSFVMDEFVCLSGIIGFDPGAGAIFAFENPEDSATLCRRELSSDTVLEARPLADNQELESLTVLGDGSELVGEAWDSDAQQYLMVRFDPTTLELLEETVLDPNRLNGVGIGVELIEDREFNLTLEPSGVGVPSGLNRPRFSPDGSLLWAVDDDLELIIDVATGEPIGRFELGRGHLYYAWSADGSILVTPTLGTTLQVFRP